MPLSAPKRHEEKTRMKGLGVALASAIWLCQPVTMALADRSRSQEILHIMERVADWELAHRGNASLPVSSPEVTKPLGWVVGTFYTGLAALADRSTDPHYADAVFSLGEQQ